MALLLRPEAELDLLGAAAWYDGERPGLGVAFLDEIRATLGQIEEMPLRFPVVADHVRRAIAGRFPFGVFFLHEATDTTAIAILHLHRHSDSWQSRL